MDIANVIAKELREHGIMLRSMIENDKYGMDLRSTTLNMIQESNSIIFIVSENSNKSKSFHNEIYSAMAFNEKQIITIQVNGASIPTVLQNHLYISVSSNDLNGLKNTIPKIEASIRSFSAKFESEKLARKVQGEHFKGLAKIYIDDSIEKLRFSTKAYWLFCATVFVILFGFSTTIILVGYSDYIDICEDASVDIKRMIVLMLAKALIAAVSFYIIYILYHLGLMFASEAIRNSDRIHKINYGKLYIESFPEGYDWEKLKDVFSKWNTETESQFSTNKANGFISEKVIESVIDKILVNKKEIV